mmetsp:Transcript_20808/g.26933  ORF Transcript_20808/g.26933 Transcript_20808/m.26933 type:complete len:86 (+) Transcript_20808:799-1056(+)
MNSHKLVVSHEIGDTFLSLSTEIPPEEDINRKKKSSRSHLHLIPVTRKSPYKYLIKEEHPHSGLFSFFLSSFYVSVASYEEMLLS